ncbi:MAG TPA: RHS repeat-associated core domain-containing protein [Anaeromyxobacteraceae bacterium]|nr:RHS repeat-associated core domain-containing protein [Anaeromyxobacteraceae bacterium]
MTVTRSNGTVVLSTRSPDPRFGLSAPLIATTISTPGGLAQTSSEARSVQLSDPVNLLSLTKLTDTRTVNGRNTVTTYDAATRRGTLVTPAGRTMAWNLDEKGRLVHLEPPGYPALYATDTSYDALGRLQAVGQGARATTFTYDSNGLPSTILDPASQTTGITYDLAGRTATLALPGNRLVSFGYDASGNLASLAPPGRSGHGFAFDAVDRLKEYAPPLLPGLTNVSTSYTYSRNGDPLGIWLPDGTAALASYETGAGGQLTGRVASVTDARGTTSMTYDSAGRVATLTTPGGQSLAYSYDGFLVTGEISTGAIQGSVAYGFDGDFRVTSLGANGSSASFAYDPDGLLTRAGAETITRDAVSGRFSGTALGAVTTSTTYNAYGEVASFSASVSGSTLFSYDLGRDLKGRIVSRTDRVLGGTTAYDYGYDASGRLSDVTAGGQLQATYLYDGNGNLTRKTSLAAGVEEGATDAQDRLLSFGTTTYAYGPNGDLTSKTSAGATTAYSYDRQGNLLSVALPDGRRIDYIVDGRNRRVGKKVNGQLVEGFLYDGQLRPIAWLDGTGAAKATFVYGLHVNVPEYMVTATSTYRILTDHLGSPRLVVDTASGAVVQRMDYDAWGQVLSDTAPGFQPFGFAGGLWDRDTGLVRFGARDYDPSVGRWTNKDPIRFDGGTTNLYEYAANDPVSYSDPSGLVPTWLKAVVLAWQALWHTRLPPRPPFDPLQPPPPRCPVAGPPPPPPPPTPWEPPLPLYPWITFDPSLYPPELRGQPDLYGGA